MSRIRFILILLIVVVVALVWWIHRRSARPIDVPFAKVKRETLVSTLATNGKAEPSDWVAVRAERPGVIQRVDVHLGQNVEKGAFIAELDDSDARAAVAAAEAEVVEARAQLQTVLQGGATQARVDIDNALSRDGLDLAAAQRDQDALKRLAEKQAATGQDVYAAGQRVRLIQADIHALTAKRAALVGMPDRATAEAKLREAQAAVEEARASLEHCHIHSPVSGTVYDLPARTGAYVNAGDLVADVGNLDVLRVRVYVDEPELGRVGAKMPVTITWDALPGRQWKGEVEKLPTQIVPLGTRQVGEVICTIQNPDHTLIPGTNVNAEIVSQVVASGLTIPKEAIRRIDNRAGVFLLRDDKVEWRTIELGASSVTRAAVVSGLAEGDMVALNSETVLHDGQRVEPAEQ